MTQPADMASLTAATSLYHLICSWCQCDLGPLWYASGGHSFGICTACQHHYFAELYAHEVAIAQGLAFERAVGYEYPQACNRQVADHQW